MRSSVFNMLAYCLMIFSLPNIYASSLLAAANAWYSKERNKHFKFSNPYAENNIKLVKNKGQPFDYKGLNTIKQNGTYDEIRSRFGIPKINN